MDDAARVPIDLGYASVEERALASNRVQEREDGTLIIDILVRPQCEPASNGEIVVCAVLQEEERYRSGIDDAPPDPSVIDRIGGALNIKIGPMELGSIEQGEGVRSLGARVRF